MYLFNNVSKLFPKQDVLSSHMCGAVMGNVLYNAVEIRVNIGS